MNWELNLSWYSKKQQIALQCKLAFHVASQNYFRDILGSQSFIPKRLCRVRVIGARQKEILCFTFLFYPILLWSYESYWVLAGMGCFHSTCPTKVFTYYDRQDCLRGCGVGGEDPAMPGIFQHRLVGDSDMDFYVFTCFFAFFERFWAFLFAWIFVQVFFWCWCYFWPGAAVNRHLPSASPSLCAGCCFRRLREAA